MSARPDSFFLFLILIPVLFIMMKRYLWGRKDLNAIGAKCGASLFMDVFITKWVFSSIIFILFIIFLILSLAEFTGRGRIMLEPSSGIDLVFAVDISGSMLATDIYPSRLNRSVDLVSAFLKNLPGERFGLVVFKGKGIKLLPVTEDSSAVQDILPFLGPSMFSSEGSNLEQGFLTAMDSFIPGEEREKIILLFTDGESLSGSTSMLEKYTKDQDINVIIFGTGTEAGIELYSKEGKPLLNKDGEIVISKLNSTLLKDLASTENITYLDISNSAVFNDSLVIINKKLKSNVIVDQKETHYRVFLSFAILFLFLYISVRIFSWKDTF